MQSCTVLMPVLYTTTKAAQNGFQVSVKHGALLLRGIKAINSLEYQMQAFFQSD